jgi:LPPG:FO 2-phospho-L-lactate transferase
LKITALAGGVGAARFLTGLIQRIKEEDLSIIVNTGDDINLFGLHISPDIDIVTYTLAGIVDEQKGWGIKGDTFQCFDLLKNYEKAVWFNLGDRDLATHIYRTSQLRAGKNLTQISAEVSKSFGLKTRILPMSNDPFETRVTTPSGSMHFEEYYVKTQCSEEVLAVEFSGEAAAKPAPGVLEAIYDSELIVICPSNPIVSIGTILAVQGIRGALKQTSARKVAVSPIVAGVAIKGPAEKMLRSLGYEVSAFGVAELYSDFLDAIVIDSKDADKRGRIETLGVKVSVTNTIMKTLADKISLAETVLEA